MFLAFMCIFYACMFPLCDRFLQNGLREKKCVARLSGIHLFVPSCPWLVTAILVVRSGSGRCCSCKDLKRIKECGVGDEATGLGI